MRIVSILTALLVAAVLYGVVLERDRLLGWAGVAPAPETAGAGAATAAESAPAMAVMARHSSAREIDDAVILRGETQPSREVEVRAEASGRVISEPLAKGSAVAAGDMLCRLDPGTSGASLEEARAGLAEALAQRPQVEARIPEAEAQLAQAEASVEETQINLTAAQELSKGGYTSRTSLASAQAAHRAAQAGVVSAEAGLEAARAGLEELAAAVQSARATVARAETAVANLTISAPFGGVLEDDTAELGALMSVGSACATVLQLDPLKLVGYVPETDVMRVRTGARAMARLVDGETVTGMVTYISRRADDTTRTFRVEIALANPALAIRAGQTAEIAIEAEGARAHLLPQSALTLDDDGQLGIRSVAGGDTVKFLPVTVLRDEPQGIWVAGLPDSVDVITVGQEYVTDGVRVAPSFEELLP